jgi:ribonucleotide reductase alpha subunit
VLAGRILVSNLQKQTAASLYDVSLALTNNINPQTGKRSSLLSEKYFALVEKHHKELEEMIDYERDYKYGFLAFCTLTRQSYLLKSNGVILERPQHWHMRVALNIHGDDLGSVKRTYDSLSLLEYCHATPTGLNSGTPNPQLSSCFLLPPVGDSIEGIYDALKDCAMISKTAGGYFLARCLVFLIFLE